ncbi:MAG: class I adenylate-forming enzyme family protein [Desulfatiglandales bacterium]
MQKRLILRELSRYNIGTYADVIYRNALLRADWEAFIYGKERITFAQFNGRVNNLIHALLSLGVVKGDVLGILSWNGLECNDICGAAMKGGYIASPFNPRLKAEELQYLINYSEANTLFVGAEFIEMVGELRPRLTKVKHFISLGEPFSGMISYEKLLVGDGDREPDVQVEEDDPLIIFYTSGTTGLPRGALYTHFRKMEESRTKALQLRVEEGDRSVAVLPLFHIGGWSYFWTFFCAGACNIIMSQRNFDPEATLRTIQDEKATDIHIVPTQLVAILNLDNLEDCDLSALKRIWYAASPMPTEILRRGIEAFGPRFMQCYGQSESGPDITFLSDRDHQVVYKSADEQAILASCGRPCETVHMRIIDEANNDLGPGEVGEIIVRSKRVMKEYWRRPDETSETLIDGWLHTGDMGYYDDKGYVFIVDRKKDMIITGGENVYPREVEEILYRHPAINEAAVIGIPDPYWVEKVHAVVTLKRGAQATEEEIREFCKAHLAGYKTPKSVEFVISLPKNPQGKILKRELSAGYSQKQRTM